MRKIVVFILFFDYLKFDFFFSNFAPTPFYFFKFISSLILIYSNFPLENSFKKTPISHGTFPKAFLNR